MRDAVAASSQRAKPSRSFYPDQHEPPTVTSSVLEEPSRSADQTVGLRTSPEFRTISAWSEPFSSGTNLLPDRFNAAHGRERATVHGCV